MLAFGGGDSRIEGGFASFNVIEAHQGELRVANSLLEENADGIQNQQSSRVDLGGNDEAVIFVRGSEAIVINNSISNNDSVAISIDVNSLNSRYVQDSGRQTAGDFD